MTAATILIVDDDPDVIRTFGDWLSRGGYEIRTASNGEEALQALAAIDAIVVDLHMPIVDGLAFLRHIRARGNRVPVAMLTGDYLLDDAILKECEALDTHLMFKPVWLDELTALVGELIARRRAA